MRLRPFKLTHGLELWDTEFRGKVIPAVSIVLLVCAVAAVALTASRMLSVGVPVAQLGGAVLVFLFLVIAAWLFGEVSELELSKAKALFSWSRRRLFVKHEGHMPLITVTKARRDILMDSEGRSYRFLIETARGMIPFTQAFSGNGEELSRISDDINSYIKASHEQAT